jgi:hypothetical protein
MIHYVEASDLSRKYPYLECYLEDYPLWKGPYPLLFFFVNDERQMYLQFNLDRPIEEHKIFTDQLGQILEYANEWYRKSI